MATKSKLGTLTAIAELIEATSERLCRDHYDMGPLDGWFFGGSSHNDDRLTATVQEDGTILIKDGGGFAETYDGPLEDAPARAYVLDRLRDAWANA